MNRQLEFSNPELQAFAEEPASTSIATGVVPESTPAPWEPLVESPEVSIPLLIGVVVLAKRVRGWGVPK